MIHPKPGEALPPPLANLQTHYRDWSIWTSRGDGGFAPRCYATRLAALTTDQMNAGLAMTVQSPTPDGLQQRLAQQDQLEQLLAGREPLA